MIPIVTKFTTNAEDYDLMQNTDVIAKLAALFGYDQIASGLALTIEVKVAAPGEGTPTQIKVNGRSFYDDLIDGTTWSSNGRHTITSLKIKDTGIVGIITIK